MYWNHLRKQKAVLEERSENLKNDPKTAALSNFAVRPSFLKWKSEIFYLLLQSGDLVMGVRKKFGEIWNFDFKLNWFRDI